MTGHQKNQSRYRRLLKTTAYLHTLDRRMLLVQIIRNRIQVAIGSWPSRRLCGDGLVIHEMLIGRARPNHWRRRGLRTRRWNALRRSRRLSVIARGIVVATVIIRSVARGACITGCVVTSGGSLFAAAM